MQHSRYTCIVAAVSNVAHCSGCLEDESTHTKYIICMCGDGGRVVIGLHTDPENRGTGAYQLLTLYTHGVPHVDCEGPNAVTRTNLLLPPGRKALKTHPHWESNRALQFHACMCKSRTARSMCALRHVHTSHLIARQAEPAPLHRLARFRLRIALPLLPAPAAAPALRPVLLPLLLLSVLAWRQAIQLHTPILRGLRSYTTTIQRGGVLSVV
mgnify:CR=1 FL=1